MKRFRQCADTAGKKMKIIKCYSELIQIPDYQERFEYLKLAGQIGESTFGFDRWLNQNFYRSAEWKRVREQVIIRDFGCDLAHRDYPIGGQILIHHMNPIELADITEKSSEILNPNYLVCVSKTTHNAIHYGDAELLPKPPIERRANDTCPWRR